MSALNIGLAAIALLTAHLGQPSNGSSWLQEGKEGRKDTYLSEDGPGGLEGYSFYSQTIGKHLKFVIRRHAGKKADIVMIEGRSHSTMPDERIVEPDNDHTPDGPRETVFEPGQTFKGYGFYPSQDRRWLFVVRGGFRRFAVCYLYRRVSSRRMVPVHPGGLRLDDAAIRLMAAAHRWSFQKLRGGARNASFEKWDVVHHRLVFWVHAASDWYPETKDTRKRGVLRAMGIFYFDLKRGIVQIGQLDQDYSDYVE